MQPLQRAHLIVLLLTLCVTFGQVDEVNGQGEVPKTTQAPTPKIPVASLSPPCSSPLLFFLALGLAVAFFLQLH